MTQALLEYKSLSRGDLRDSARRATICLLAAGLAHVFCGLLLGILTLMDSPIDVVLGIIPGARLSDVAPFFDDGIMHLVMAFAYLMFARVVRGRGRGWIMTAMIVTSILLGLLVIGMAEDVLRGAGVLLGLQLAIDILLHVCLIRVLMEVLQAEADRRVTTAEISSAAVTMQSAEKNARPAPPRVRPWRLPTNWGTR